MRFVDFNAEGGERLPVPAKVSTRPENTPSISAKSLRLNVPSRTDHSPVSLKKIASLAKRRQDCSKKN
jgi:hypothetical protein